MKTPASEKRAGGASGENGNIHVFWSDEYDGWARLCAVSDDGSPRRADTMLAPADSQALAHDIELSRGKKTTDWRGQPPTNYSGPARLVARGGKIALEVRCCSHTVSVTAGHEGLMWIAAALRAVSGSEDDAARRRMDSNLRGVFS